jgi:guanylate kinase
MSHKPGHPIVFSAPSGAGKTTIIHRVMEEMGDLSFSISSTTRPIREGETEGIDYDFLSAEKFQLAIDDDDFIEYEDVHIYRYGTRKSRVNPLLESGKDVVFDLDVLGALNIKRLYPDCLMIYIDVLSKNVLRDRLIGRGREDISEIEKRLERYEMERSKADEYNIIVVNDDLEFAVQEVKQAIASFR